MKSTFLIIIARIPTPPDTTPNLSACSGPGVIQDSCMLNDDEKELRLPTRKPPCQYSQDFADCTLNFDAVLRRIIPCCICANYSKL